MSRARRFTKAEMRDAATLAAENGVRVLLHPTGEIEFTLEQSKREAGKPGSSVLERWLDENKAGWRA